MELGRGASASVRQHILLNDVCRGVGHHADRHWRRDTSWASFKFFYWWQFLEVCHASASATHAHRHRFNAAHASGQTGIRWATPLTHDDGRDTDTGQIRYRRLSCVLDATEDEAIRELGEQCMLAAEEPQNINEAIADEAWRAAMDEEMASITENKTWELSALPRGHKAIGLKWVFKVKRDAAGNLVKYKARLVAKGYAQRQGVDFEEIFAPVARMETVRVLLALAAHSGWEVHHMDVKSAFLNGVLSEEVYVCQPPGYVVAGKETAESSIWTPSGTSGMV